MHGPLGMETYPPTMKSLTGGLPGHDLKLACFVLPKSPRVDGALFRFQQPYECLGTIHGILLPLIVVEGRLRVARADAPEGDLFPTVLVVVLVYLIMQRQHVERGLAHAIVDESHGRKLCDMLASGYTRWFAL